MASTDRRKTGKKVRGRPKGSGGPIEKLRRNRVVVMVTDAEFAKLQKLAQNRDEPVATVAYQLLAPALRRAR